MMSRIPTSPAGWEMVDFTVSNGCGMHRCIKTCQNRCSASAEVPISASADRKSCQTALRSTAHPRSVSAYSSGPRSRSRALARSPRNHLTRSASVAHKRSRCSRSCLAPVGVRGLRSRAGTRHSTIAEHAPRATLGHRPNAVIVLSSPRRCSLLDSSLRTGVLHLDSADLVRTSSTLRHR